MRRRKERRPEPEPLWFLPPGGTYRGTGRRVGLPPTTPGTDEGFRRQEREEREREEAEGAVQSGSAGG